MKGKRFLISFLLLYTSVFLTSCKVNWFDKSYDLPWLFVAIPTVLFVLIVMIAAGKYIAKKTFVCEKCYKSFHPKWWKAMLSLHVNDDRIFKCPHCGKRGFCHVSSSPDNNE